MSDTSQENAGTKKRRPPWILATVVFGLLLLLFMFQSSNVWRSLPVSGSGETLILYALSSLNFAAFIVFAFMLARSLIKLRQQTKARQLGSKLKRRLLLYFAGITLLPLIAMAVFSYLFMNRALERWFTQLPENVVREAGKLQIDIAEDQQIKAERTVQMVAQLLKRTGTNEAVLEELRLAGNLAFIQVIDDRNRSVMSSEDESLGEEEKELTELKDLIARGELNNVLLSDGRGYDAVLADLSDGQKLVIIPAAGPKGDVGELVNSSLNDFDRLKASQIFVRQLGLTTLGLLTFLLIFASSWAAFYVARGLTRPIRALAEGADEVARGDFSYRVNVRAEDELELLVRSFNAMTGALEEKSEALEERRRYIETILQSLSAGVISFDSKNRVRTINRAARRLLLLQKDDYIGYELGQLVGEDNRAVFEKLISQSGRIGYSFEQTELSRETDEEQFNSKGITVAFAASRLPNDGGTVIVIEDLSELITAQRAAAWQEVARRMAHEIKNPLTPIQLSAERIAKKFAGSGNGVSEKVVSEGTETILNEVASLKSMVDEFSRFARLPDPEMSELDLDEVIRQSVSLYEDREFSAAIEMRLDPNVPVIMADREQLKRVFVNLIDNAIESFRVEDDRNLVVVSTELDEAKQIVRIKISDNGAGIASEHLARLFQPYFSTKGRGTGLGLAIVQRIVREHKGTIQAAHNFGGGSLMIVELPLSQFE
ncbi:MAG: HAMP domain-containing protein [Pyrinomonadaceae bacterium]|nr:HAMP domain-containing protein [Pyrinomonadaceae bacterium]